jgi:hypothetical protein
MKNVLLLGKSRKLFGVVCPLPCSLLMVGKLDISGLNLQRIPPDVYIMIGGMDVKSLTRPPSPPRPKESTIRPLGGAPREESKEAVFNQPTRETWVDPEELTAFKVADNRILELEREIGAFGGLRSIDVCPLLQHLGIWMHNG